MKGSIIAGKAYVFAFKIIPACKKMNEQKEYVISRQLLKSATSIGANIEEASAASSTRDFISKMSISSKEARETRYWLRLISDSKIIEGISFDDLLIDIEEIVRILTKIVKTTQLEQNK